MDSTQSERKDDPRCPSAGRFIAVVGPSGVGKDTVMSALADRYDTYVLARRVITRSHSAGGESFESVPQAVFTRRANAGEFVLHWAAHGLSYGIPTDVTGALAGGRDVLANLSRDVLSDAYRLFPGMRIIALTASTEVLVRRLTERGRETPKAIAARLAKADRALPLGLPVKEIWNDGDLEETIATLHAALQPERAARCT